MVFESAPGMTVSNVDVRVGGKPLTATHRRDASRVELALSTECMIRRGESIVVVIT